jgi:hypothetical protein
VSRTDSSRTPDAGAGGPKRSTGSEVDSERRAGPTQCEIHARTRRGRSRDMSLYDSNTVRSSDREYRSRVSVSGRRIGGRLPGTATNLRPNPET